jgi:hypothetical protein
MWTLLMLASVALSDESTLPAAAVRARAAARLERALDETRAARPEAAADHLRREAEAALEPLAGSRAARRLGTLLSSASERTSLERELKRLAEDLAFEPLLEAALPAGFPLPTALGEIELKAYPAYRMARAENDWTQRSGAFWKLFRHITSRDIAMTAPVEMTWEAGGERLRERSMAFLYGRPDLGSTGRVGDVEVLDVPAAQVASLGLRGRPSASEVAAARAELLAWIAERGDLEVCGELRVLGYNGPSVSDRRATSEVQIPVRARSAG